jgi:hypothetical protein
VHSIRLRRAAGSGPAPWLSAAVLLASFAGSLASQSGPVTALPAPDSITAPGRSGAPAAEAKDVRHEVFAGGELERYLRVLQLSGAAPLQPWSVRGLSPREIERGFGTMSRHPWERRYRMSRATAGLHVGWVTPQAQAIFNSAFPFGADDGAVWAGRGLTSVVQGGFSLQQSALSLVIAPVLFRAENGSFDLAPGAEDDPFADPRFPEAIDLPQRFGDGAYTRLDPGQSTLRIDLPAITAGVSTANQTWGPGREYPILVGANAPGYPHAFVGTGSPLNVGIGRVHGRFVWGRLDQSAHSPVTSGEARRFMSGLVGVYLPRWVPGLELGAARFFHSPWPADGLEPGDFLKPLEGVLKVRLEENGVSAQDNQLASAFFRWAVPRAGFEVYGEFAREDHSYDLRDLLLEPDHNSAYMLGFSRAWTTSAERTAVVSGEVVNAEVSHLARVRPQWPFYIHQWTLQGHTHRGQIIGSPAAYGGSGVNVAVDLYHPLGRWTLEWSRLLRDRRGRYWEEGVVERNGADVSHVLEGQVVWFRGPVDVLASAAAVYEFNRNFSGDMFNLNATLGLRWIP